MPLALRALTATSLCCRLQTAVCLPVNEISKSAILLRLKSRRTDIFVSSVYSGRKQEEPQCTVFKTGRLRMHQAASVMGRLNFRFAHLFDPTAAFVLCVSKMVLISVLRDACNAILNAERRGKRQVILRPVSKVIIKYLQLLQKYGYIGEFEYVDDKRSGKIVVELNGRLNKCGVISPRYNISHNNMEHWVGRVLPSRLFGHIVLTTSSGIMTHSEARRKKIGGKVLGYFY